MTVNRRRIWMVSTLCAASCGIGCETISQDLDALNESLSTPTPLEAARMMFDSHNADNRRRGTVLLSNSDFGGNPQYVEAYRAMVQDERNPLVLAAAIRALAKHADAVDAPLIAAQLKHENLQVRWEAAKGLQRLHNPSVVGELLTVLRDVDQTSDVRVAIAQALGQYPQDRVFQGLIAALDARELAVNRAAEQSLNILTGESRGESPTAWLNWYNQRIAERTDPFAGSDEYLYPTYHRSRSWWEYLAFWSQPIRENPGMPAGLEPVDRRTTWDDEAEGESARQ